METPKSRPKQAPAFNFCKALNALVVCSAVHATGCCQTSRVYLPRPTSVVFKERSAKQIEASSKPQPSAFELHDIPKRWQRTAKHKRFITDTGATVSVTNRADIFHTIDDYSPGKRVQVANKQFVDVVFTGTVELKMQDSKGRTHTKLLHDVCYSPFFSNNLLSVREMAKQHRFKAVFGDTGESYFKTPEGDRISIDEVGKQYYLAAYAISLFDPILWHRRFMHASTEAIKRMGCKIKGLQQYDFDFSRCAACLQGGAKKLPLHWNRQTHRRKQHLRMLERLQSKRNRFTYFGERIATDLCGPFPESVDGDLYAIIFHDSWSRYLAVYTLPDKRAETVLDAIYRFIREHDSLMPNGIGRLWTDNGGEYQNHDLEQFCEEICTKRSWTVPYNSWQNPYAERAWGTVLRKVRSSIVDGDVDWNLWSYAIKHAALVHNVLVDENCVSPYETVHGEEFDYLSLHTLFCSCHYILPEHERDNKVSPRALPARYLGVDPERKAAHIVQIPGLDGKITPAFHVVFNEEHYFDEGRSFRGKTHFRGERSEPSDPVGRSKRRVLREHRDDEPNAQPQPNAQPTENAQPHIHLRDDLPDTEHPADDTRHGSVSSRTQRGDWNENHCRNSKCVYPRGHSGPCSHEEVREQDRFRPLPPHRYTYSACANPGCIFHVAHSGPCMDDDETLLPSLCRTCDSDDGDYNAQLINDSSDEFASDMLGKIHLVLDEATSETLSIDVNIGDLTAPKRYEEAIKGILGKRWQQSMESEIESILKSETWDTVSRNDPRLRGRTPTKSRWVYTIKYKRNGDIEKFKSRFVVCGYSQRKGIDYDRAFSSTLRAATFRTICALAAGEKLKLEHFDVTSAFTQADLDDVDLFVEPPKGFEEWECCDRKTGPCVCGKRRSKLLHLKKALYGSKQASRLWQETLRSFLVGQGFTSSSTDPCLFVKSNDAGKLVVGTYVDDLVVAYRGEKMFKDFDEAFRKAFRAHHLGKLDWFLGMGIDQHEDFSVDINQTAYIEKMAAKFINTNISRTHPPKDIFESLDRAQNDMDRARVAEKPYMSIVGSLLYASVMSRPDISYHTSVLAKFMSDPSPDCFKAAVQLMEYLYTTRDRKFSCTGKVVVPIGLEKVQVDITRNCGFYAYSDSSWGNKYPYPMFGHCIYLYGTLVSYSTKQLKVVAFSSCEAEYAAATACCKEMEFVRNVCFDLGMKLHGRLVLAVDNTAVIDVAHDVGVTPRTKHFDRAMHYLRDLVQLRRVIPIHVRTHIQRADGLTKALDKAKYFDWLKMFYP